MRTANYSRLGRGQTSLGSWPLLLCQMVTPTSTGGRGTHVSLLFEQGLSSAPRCSFSGARAEQTAADGMAPVVVPHKAARRLEDTFCGVAAHSGSV